jgi:predicted phosphatase
MTEIKLEDVKNLDQPSVQELLNKFKNRNEMNVVDVAEIISKLISTLGIDHDSGRPKQHTISGGHLGQILGIGKGVVSQYLAVWNMSEEAKKFLRNYNISLINAYTAAKVKGKDAEEILKFQKEIIINKSVTPYNGLGKRVDILLHSTNEAQMVLNGIVSSYKIPAEILKPILKPDSTEKEHLIQNAKTYLYNTEQCINYLCPKLVKLPFLQKEIEFCTIMNEYGEVKFCGKDIDIECLNKQIKFLSEEIISIEVETKLPHISSLLMMKENLEKNI